jgi:YegS/Rv2252/BmrU family lipid kinase
MRIPVRRNRRFWNQRRTFKGATFNIKLCFRKKTKVCIKFYQVIFKGDKLYGLNPRHIQSCGRPGPGTNSLVIGRGCLADAGIEFDSVATHGPLDALRLAGTAPEKYTAVVGVGGDGTFHEIVNGLMRASGERETIPLGIIPLGNGDDFAKMLPPETPIGGKTFGWREAVQRIGGGQTQSFDVGRIRTDNVELETASGPQYFINSIDVGFGARTTLNLATVPKWITGLPAYFAAVIKTLMAYKNLEIRLQLDGGAPLEIDTTLTVVMNGRCFGSGFWVCPEAQADDGQFDVLITEALNRRTILRLAPKLMKGQHLKAPEVNLRRARRVVIESVEPLLFETDGEILPQKIRRLELEILPKKLQVMV